MKTFFVALSFLFLATVGANTPLEFRYTVSIVAISQNEAPYLKEWIDYHLSLGVEHFWIYTNNCTDNTNEVLKDYQTYGIVEVIDWPSDRLDNEWHDFTFRVQPGSYNDCLNRCRGITKWLAVIDTDKFIMPIANLNLPDLLETSYPYVSGLFLNWQCFGHNDQQADDQGGNKYITHKLTRKMKWDHEWNRNGKLIVQPLHVDHFWYPHDCYFTANHWSVNTHFEANPRGWSAPVYIDILYLNHYWARDLDFYTNVKLARYAKWNGTTLEDMINREKCMRAEYDTKIIEIQEVLK